MYIKQLSIFAENKPGILEGIIKILSENNINIRALSVADTTEYGIVRMIVDDADKAREVLKELGVISKCTDVVAVIMDDRSGGLAKILNILTSEKISIDYMYAFLSRTEGKALMVVKTDNEEKTEKILTQNGIELATPDM